MTGLEKRSTQYRNSSYRRDRQTRKWRDGNDFLRLRGHRLQRRHLLRQLRPVEWVWPVDSLTVRISSSSRSSAAVRRLWSACRRHPVKRWVNFVLRSRSDLITPPCVYRKPHYEVDPGSPAGRWIQQAPLWGGSRKPRYEADPGGPALMGSGGPSIAT